MRNIFKIIYVSIVFLSIGCEEGERFSGSPVGTSEIITVDAIVAADVTSALTDQKVNFTVTLPRTFSDTVSVEATSISDSGRRTRAYAQILPNQLSGTGEINAAGGGIFDTTFDLYLTAIELFTVEKGKHYLIKSNNLEINTGNTTIQDVDTRRLSVKLVWPNFATNNNLRFNIDKPTLGDANVTSLSGGKTHFFNVADSPNNTTTNSAEVGDYTLNITAISLLTTPIDMPYRLVLVYPNGKVEVFNGVYPGLTVGSPLRAVLKINKSVVDGVVKFTPTLP
jgi:hypothetical protein